MNILLLKDKKHIFIFMALIIATVLGIYAQSITYCISESIIDLPLGLVIVAITNTIICIPISAFSLFVMIM